jgi:hypothetical protein
VTDAFVAGLRELFGDDLIGVYRHESEVLGGDGPRSDVDILAVTRGTSRTTSATIPRRTSSTSGGDAAKAWDQVRTPTSRPSSR